MDQDSVYLFNVCGPVQCGAQMSSEACKQPAKPPSTPSPKDLTQIGSMTPVAQPLTPMDIQNINWKTGNVRNFPPNTPGIKLIYPPYGVAPTQGAGGYGQQASPYGQQPGGYSAPTPPPYGQNPYGSNPYGASATPAHAAGGGSQSALGLTILLPCDAQLPASDGRAMQFTQGQPYKDHTTGYMFVLASHEGCPLSIAEEFESHWGWVFNVCLLSLTILYCGIGAFYKYKKLGVTGLEMLPHIEFWRDLPGLVKDGILYTIAKARACVGKGPSGYSTV